MSAKDFAVPAALLLGGYLLFRPNASGESALSGLLGGGEASIGDTPLGAPPPSSYDSRGSYQPRLGPTGIDAATGINFGTGKDYTSQPTVGVADDAGAMRYGGTPGTGKGKPPGFLSGVRSFFTPENLGYTAPFIAIPAAATIAARGAGPIRSLAQGSGQAIRSAAGAMGRVAPRALPAVSFAGAALGGAALGEVGVIGLQRSGALNALASSSQRAPVSAPTREYLQTAFAPLNYLGALASGLAGHGSVSGNIQVVNRGVGRTVNRATSLFRRIF